MLTIFVKCILHYAEFTKKLYSEKNYFKED